MMIRSRLIAFAVALAICIAGIVAGIGHAQIGPGPLMSPLPITAAPSSITFETNSDSTSCGASCSFPSLSIGPVCPNRTVIITAAGLNIGNTGAQSATGTIGGISFTTAVAPSTNNGSNGYFGLIASAPVPSGTTATVAITYGISTSRTSVGVWAACNLQSTTKKLTNAANGAGSSITLSINDVAGDVGVAVNHTDSGGITPSWSGATLGYTDNVGGTGSVDSGASWAETTTQTPRAITNTWSCGSTTCTGASATWH